MTQIDPCQYLNLALSTESRVQEDNSEGGPRFQHAVYGINTEASELLESVAQKVLIGLPIDLYHIVEELGDIMWYVAIMYSHLYGDSANEQLDRDVQEAKDKCHPIQSNTLYLALSIESSGNWFLDQLKRGKFYGSWPELSVLCVKIRELIAMVQAACCSIGVDILSVMAANIAKLSRRYPDKFSNSSAVCRDLQGEMDALKEVLRYKNEPVEPVH